MDGRAARRGGLAWRRSLGAGVLAGIGLGCVWLAHALPLFWLRAALIAAAAALIGLALLLGQRRAGRAWALPPAGHFTEAGVPFLAAIAILALAALGSGNNLLYLMDAALIAALVVSSLTSALNLSGMVLRFRLPEEIYAGRAAAVAFTLTNEKGFWPAYSLTVSADAPSRGGGAKGAMRPVYFAYLPRHGSVKVTGEIEFPRRGRYTSAAFTLSTRFPFALANKRRRFQSSGREPEMLVYPAPLAAAERGAALAAGGEWERPQPGSGQELYRIRPHAPGDSARAVHWKASARAGQLRVREYSEAGARRVRLRLALAPGLDTARAEAAVSRCAGLALELAAGELWLRFLGDHPGADGQPLRLDWAPAAAHRRAILAYLAVVDVSAPPRPAPERTPDGDASGELLVDGNSEGNTNGHLAAADQ